MDTTMDGQERLLTDKMEAKRERKQAGKEKLRATVCANQEETEACEEELRTAINVLQ